MTRTRFTDLNVVIIGGSSDIGKTCGEVALREGGSVVLTGRDEIPLRSVAGELSPFGSVGLVELDIADLSSVAVASSWRMFRIGHASIPVTGDVSVARRSD